MTTGIKPSVACWSLVEQMGEANRQTQDQCSVSAGASLGSDTGRVGKRSRNVV